MNGRVTGTPSRWAVTSTAWMWPGKPAGLVRDAHHDRAAAAAIRWRADGHRPHRRRRRRRSASPYPAGPGSARWSGCCPMTCPGWTWAPASARPPSPICWRWPPVPGMSRGPRAHCPATTPSSSASSACWAASPTVAQVNAALRVLGHIGDPGATTFRRGLRRSRSTISPRCSAAGPGRWSSTGRGPWSHSCASWTARALLPARRHGRGCAWWRPAGKQGVVGHPVLSTYVVAALSPVIRAAALAAPWQHVVFLLGAEKVRGDVLDRLADACTASRTGLVLAYRSIPASVRERLGRGNAAVAFMRLGNAADAKAAGEQIGTEHRFVLSQLSRTRSARRSRTPRAVRTPVPRARPTHWPRPVR